MKISTNKMLKLFLTLFLICIAGIGNYLPAQKHGQDLIDSLHAHLATAKEDSNRVNILVQLCEHEGWRKDRLSLASKYAEEALSLAQKLDYKRGIAVTYNNFGVIYLNQSNYFESLKNIFKAIEIFESINQPEETAWPYLNAGNSFVVLGKYTEAMKCYLKSLEIFKSIENVYGMATCYSNIGIIYESQKDYTTAIENYLTSLKIVKKAGDTNGIATCYSKIAGNYINQGKFTQALHYHITALKTFNEIGNITGQIASYIGIGDVYLALGNARKALSNYMDAFQFVNEDNKYGKSTCYTKIGTAYSHLNEPKQGKEWLLKGLSLSKMIGAKEVIMNSYLGLARTDSILGNHKSTLNNFKNYILYQDSVYNEGISKQLTQTALQYEFDKKKLSDSLNNVQMRSMAVEKLKKQKIYTALGIGLAILFLGFSVFIFRNNKILAKEKQKSESLLLNILPSEVANELIENGQAEAKQFDQVSILFTDFVEFIEASERLPPQELLSQLNDSFTAFDDIMDRYGLEKIKTVGDAYLAACGLPIADPDHAKKTVQAALEILAFIEEKRGKQAVFNIRIGINSGSVIAGIVGVKKFAYDIWGDTVNTAARMEQSSEPGKINISEATYQLVKDEFNCTYRGKIKAKGKGEVEMYFVE